MEFEPKERGLVEVYLRTSAEPDKRWLVYLVAGLVACLAMIGVVVLTDTTIADPWTLLTFMLGLVIMSRALDDRNRTLLAGIIQKYERAVSEGKPEQQ